MTFADLIQQHADQRRLVAEAAARDELPEDWTLGIDFPDTDQETPTMKTALSNLWAKIRNEPVVVIESLSTAIAAGVGLGLYSAETSTAAAVAVAAGVKLAGTLFARSKVTPV